MENNQNRRDEEIFGVKVRAGRKRTYFFDVKPTKQGDYYICITESKRRFDDSGYDRHKIYIYKEDFNKFQTGLDETINYVKTELLPEFDFDMFTRDKDDNYRGRGDAEKTDTADTQNNNDAMSLYEESSLNTEEEPSSAVEDPKPDDSTDIDAGETW